MGKNQVTCDGCAADLTYTSNCEDWRLVVCSEPKPLNPECNGVTLMAFQPPTDRQYYFCGWQCVATFLTAGPSPLKEGSS